MGSCESNLSKNAKSEEELAQTKKEKDEVMEKLLVAGAAAGVALVGWGIGKLLSGSGESSTNKKMMKTPGRDLRIFRDDFERDPAGYFHNLRNSK